VRTAKLEIQRNEERQLTQLTMGGITTVEARSYLESMPTPEQLLIPPREMRLEDGEVIMLDAETTGTTGVLVAVERKDVTDDPVNCNACSVCGKALAAGKGLYGSNACRQAAYCRRQGVAK